MDIVPPICSPSTSSPSEIPSSSLSPSSTLGIKSESESAVHHSLDSWPSRRQSLSESMSRTFGNPSLSESTKLKPPRLSQNPFSALSFNKSLSVSRTRGSVPSVISAPSSKVSPSESLSRALIFPSPSESELQAISVPSWTPSLSLSGRLTSRPKDFSIPSPRPSPSVSKSRGFEARK